MVEDAGLAIMGQTRDLAPADGRIYALRDATATVDSIPLIASSIMCKKLALGAPAMVLDVKVGSGAFMQDVEQGRLLAEEMVAIGTALGRRVVAVLTDMNQPLGRAVGNALEVQEAVQLLSGEIGEEAPLYRVCVELGAHMLLLAELAQSLEEGRRQCRQALNTGAGLAKLYQLVKQQGGDLAWLENGAASCKTRIQQQLNSHIEGYLVNMDTKEIGRAASLLGAGRSKQEDSIDPAVGLIMGKRLGEFVSRGESLCTLHVNDDSRLEEAKQIIRHAIRVDRRPLETMPLLYGTVVGDTR